MRFQVLFIYKYILLVLSFINCFICYSQYKDISRKKVYTISGFIEDSETGERLIGAAVSVNELKTGSITNSYGFYSITLPEGAYIITYSF